MVQDTKEKEEKEKEATKTERSFADSSKEGSSIVLPHSQVNLCLANTSITLSTISIGNRLLTHGKLRKVCQIVAPGVFLRERKSETIRTEINLIGTFSQRSRNIKN